MHGGLGHALLVLFALWAGFHLAGKTSAKSIPALALQGIGAGAIAGALIGSLPILMSEFKLRSMFIALNRDLLKMLTFGEGVTYGVTVLVVAGAVCGLSGAMLFLSPPRVRRPLVVGLCWAGFIGLFQELLQLMIQYESWDPIREAIFTWDGLRAQGAVGTFLTIAVIVAIWDAQRERFYQGFNRLPDKL